MARTSADSSVCHRRTRDVHQRQLSRSWEGSARRNRADSRTRFSPGEGLALLRVHHLDHQHRVKHWEFLLRWVLLGCLRHSKAKPWLTDCFSIPEVFRCLNLLKKNPYGQGIHLLETAAEISLMLEPRLCQHNAVTVFSTDLPSPHPILFGSTKCWPLNSPSDKKNGKEQSSEENGGSLVCTGYPAHFCQRPSSQVMEEFPRTVAGCILLLSWAAYAASPVPSVPALSGCVQLTSSFPEPSLEFSLPLASFPLSSPALALSSSSSLIFSEVESNSGLSVRLSHFED